MNVALAEPRSASTAPLGRRKSRFRRLSRLATYLFLLPAVLFVAATVLYPLLYSIRLSFFDVGLREIVAGGAEWVGLENYRDQWSRPAFWRAFRISVVYTTATVALTYLLGLGLALLFNQPFRGRTVMRALVLLAWILPTVVSGNVWRWLLDGSYGLLNAALDAVGLIDGEVFWLGQPNTALLAVVAASAWTFAPFAMILLLAGLQGIPGTWYEAARIDGANPLQVFRYITLPSLRPVSLTTVLICFIYTFKTFDTVFIMTGGGPGGATQILPVYAYQEAFEFSRFDTGAVATVMLMTVPLLLAAWYFRALRTEEAQ